MRQTHSRNLMCYPRSKGQDSSIEMGVGTFYRNALRTTMTTRASKFIKTIGLLIATLVAVGFTSPKLSQTYAPKIALDIRRRNRARRRSANQIDKRRGKIK